MKSPKSSHPGLTGMYRRFESCASVVARSVFAGLATPLSHHAYSLYTKGRFNELVSLSVDPSTYSDTSKFRDDYLVCELFSKFDSFDLGIDRDKVAYGKFLDSESLCEETNIRLSAANERGVYSPYSPESFLWTARVKIEQLLGPLNWDEASQYFGFGPGASSSLKRNRGDAYFKYGVVRPHTTKANALVSYVAVKSEPRWWKHLLGHRDPVTFSNLPIEQQIEELFEIVPGNRVTTVPKSAKTNRVIAVEPDLNMYIQKGIGGVIRRCLKRVGVDLDDQGLNQRLAQVASSTGAYATIDLSSASDTICLKLVELLLPPDWFEAVKQSRSPVGTMPNGTLIRYQKVSSMGNGFTFELESLIFWAICSSAMSLLKPALRQMAVYGDDLIVPTDICHTVLWLLEYVGFMPNKKKTFVSGPFRESCGKHFFLGADVTPFYIRKDIVSSDRLIHAANSIRRWARLSYGLDYRLKICYLSIVNLLDRRLRRPTIPESLGDIALWGDFDEVRPSRLGRGFEGWKAFGFQEKSQKLRPDDIPLLIRNLGIIATRRVTSYTGHWFWDYLQKVKLELDLSEVVTRPRDIKWQIVRPAVVQWESYGPWLSP